MMRSGPCRSLSLPLLLLVAVAGLAGCAGRVRTVHETPGLTRAELAAGGLGVGGVVLASRLATASGFDVPDGVPRDDVLAQADAWSGALFGALLGADAGGTVWPWTAVRADCPDSALVRVLAAFAGGGMPRPDELAALAADLPRVRYLALARIDGDETELRGDPEAEIRQQQSRDGRDPHATTRDRSLTTRRTVLVTLDVYDLADGRSVWTGTAERHREELYNFAAEGAGQEPAVVPKGEPVITARGKGVPTAEFGKVLQEACAAAAQRLLEEPRP